MTKEQEEAIKYFEDEIKVHRKQINKLKEEGQFEGNGTMIDIYKLRICMITIILNMLKEKDKEIQFQKDINKQEKDRHKQAEKSLKGQIKILKRDFKIVDQECSRLERKEEKQDKIIDLMAEHICSSAIVDDTICAIKCDCETNINEDCTHEKMLNCTKQYFEKRLEDGN